VLGRRLRALRQDQDETLAETAGRAGISPQYLSEIERGRKEASSEVLAAAAQALGLGLGDLLSLAQGELTRVTGRNAGRGRSTSATRYDGLCLAA
jgi:transcriptional regulator with XRE-family HTH domain